MNYWTLKAFFAAEEYGKASHELQLAIRRKAPMTKLLALVSEHDRLADEVKEFDRIARTRISASK